eukprot:g21249.t1
MGSSLTNRVADCGIALTLIAGKNGKGALLIWSDCPRLAQINLRKAQLGALNDEKIDGLDTPVGRQFQAQLLAALAARDGAVGQLCESALGSLTALAAQALASPDPQEPVWLW